jgi:hypothetical protein
VYRHIARLASETASHGDLLVLVLLTICEEEGLTEGGEITGLLDRFLAPEGRDALAEWRRTHPWPHDDGRSAEDLLRDGGAQALYRWWTRGHVTLTPRIFPYLDGSLPVEGRGLARRLIAHGLPWLPLAEWSADVAKRTNGTLGPPSAGVPAADKLSAGPRAVLLLPYLETAADDLSDLELRFPLPAVWPFITRRREVRDGKAPTGDVPLPAGCEPDEFWNFLQSWARNEFSVLG